jgi:hypothetical protein
MAAPYNPPRGEDHWSNKLTEDDVRHIFKLVHNGSSLSKIETTFGVCRTTVRQIRDKKIWAWLWNEEQTCISE